MYKTYVYLYTRLCVGIYNTYIMCVVPHDDDEPGTRRSAQDRFLPFL